MVVVLMFCKTFAHSMFFSFLSVGARWMWETVQDKECAQRALSMVCLMAQHTQPVIISTSKR